MRILKTINLISTLVLIAVLIVSMCATSFSWLVFVAIILQSLWALIVLGDILHSSVSVLDPLNDYAVGSLVEVTGNTGSIQHYLKVGTVYPVVSHFEGYALIVKSITDGEQRVELCDIKLFQK